MNFECPSEGKLLDIHKLNRYPKSISMYVYSKIDLGGSMVQTLMVSQIYFHCDLMLFS